MKKVLKIVCLLLVIALVGVGVTLLLKNAQIDVLSPKGEIASKERNLLIFTAVLSLIVVVPVFFMLALFSWKFREGNKKAKYTPDWDSNKFLETIWWGIPCVIILILSVVTWTSSHELDPYKPLNSNIAPLRVQVVSLQWKWLFIYPDEGIASVNLLKIPEKTPINFTVTSDAPMNSFWVPSLGGQIYAMSGMSTQLHLMADGVGSYKGSSANISGKGFADMNFMVHSSNKADFEAWVQQTKSSSTTLDASTYAQLAKPAIAAKPSFFKLDGADLYDTIVMKYMMPEAQMQMDHSHMESMSDMEGM